MFYRLFLPALLIVLAGAAAAWWIAHRGPGAIPGPAPGLPGAAGARTAPSLPDAVPDPPFTVLFAGEFGGRIWVPPCSTTGEGGVLRIQSAVAEANSITPAGMLVSTGNFVAGPGALGAMEYDVALHVLRDAGLAVAAVGEKDLAIGLERWRRVKNEAGAGIAIICANLRDGVGQTLVPGWAGLQAGNRRIVCVASLSPSFAPALDRAGVGVRLLDPLTSVRAALAEAGAAEFRVLISHAPRAESEALAAALPEIDMTITSHGGEYPSADAERVGDRVFVAAGRGWRHLGRAVFGPPGDRLSLLEYAVRGITPSVNPIEEIAFHQMRAQDEFRRQGLYEQSWRERAGSAPPGEVYAGDAACASCHASAHAVWSDAADPHRGAMDRVRDRRLERVPLCVSCHTTGAGAPGGHATPGDAMARVSCEACHGPGAAHVAAAGAVALAPARASCARCHTPEMSPAFDYGRAWEAIAHGR